MGRTVYFEPPKGIYMPRRFNDFALIDIPLQLEKMSCPSECNTERAYGKGDVSSASAKEGLTYHYPQTGIGLFYLLVRPDRCIVNLLGTRQREMDAIMEYIFEMDNKEIKESK